MNASKLQRGPSWDSSTPSTSNGTAPISRATRDTSSGDTNRNSASLSMKRSISQGHAIRSILGRSRVTHFIPTSSERSCALLAKERVQIVQHRGSAFYSCVIVVVCLDDPADESRDPGSLGAIELLVLAVDVVHDFADRAECHASQTELANKRLKRAVLSDVRVFGIEHVESKLATFRFVSARRNELESRLHIYESANQPRARDAIYMHVLTSDPGSPGLNLVDSLYRSILDPAKPSFGF